MRIPRASTRGVILSLAVIFVVGVTATAAPPETTKDPTLPGAKLLHHFKTEVYRLPVLLDTKDGPRLLLWVDAFEPLLPKPYEKAKEPVFDLFVWDVKGDKELFKLSHPKETVPLSPVAPGMASAGIFGPSGSLALSPDGKQLAATFTTYRQVPGKVYHEATGVVKLFDPDTRKWQPASATEYKQDGNKYSVPSLLFAPDGSLVILKDATCAVQEPGETKVRTTFDLIRAPKFEEHLDAYAIRDAVVSPDGARLAVAADGTVVVYDLAAGKTFFEASRAAEDAKANSSHNDARVSLAFAPDKDAPKLLAVEIVTGPPKSFVLARVFDLKEKKEISRTTLAEAETKAAPFGGALPPDWGRAYAYFTPKGEPRVLFDGKLFDPATGKKLSEFERGFALMLSHDGKYLVRVTRKKDETKMGVDLWELDNEK